MSKSKPARPTEPLPASEATGNAPPVIGGRGCVDGHPAPQPVADGGSAFPRVSSLDGVAVGHSASFAAKCSGGASVWDALFHAALSAGNSAVEAGKIADAAMFERAARFGGKSIAL